MHVRMPYVLIKELTYLLINLIYASGYMACSADGDSRRYRAYVMNLTKEFILKQTTV